MLIIQKSLTVYALPVKVRLSIGATSTGRLSITVIEATVFGSDLFGLIEKQAVKTLTSMLRQQGYIPVAINEYGVSIAIQGYTFSNG